MSYIGGPLPGQEKEEESENRDLIQSYKDRTIGKETIDRTISVVQKLQKDSPEWLKQGASTTGSLLKDTYMDVRTLEGKEWLNPVDVVTAGAVRAVEGVGKLTQPIATFGENFSHKVLGIDARGAKLLGIATEIAVTGGVTAKGTKYVKSGAAMADLTDLTLRSADPTSLAGMMYKGGAGVFPVPKKLTKTKFLSDPLYDVKTTKVNRTAGGYEGLGNQGLANIMYQNNPGLKLKFGKLRSYQQQSPFKHHHIEDIAFTGQWANTSDFEDVFKELNKIKIYPGDSPTNIIGMMDEGNLFLQTGKTDLLRELKRTNFPGLENVNRYSDLMRKEAPKGVKRLIDDVFKSPEYGDEFFKGSIDKLGRKTPNQMQNMFETLPDGTRVPTVLPQKDIGFETWKALGLDAASENFRKLPIEQQQLLKSQTWSNRFKTLGVNRKNIKYDPTKMILSKDHIDTIHYKVYDSPKFTQKRELLKMIEDGSYHTLTAKQKAEKIAEVYKVQKNTSINVAKTRLKLIKNYLKEAEPIRYRDIYSKDPTKLRQWIIDNPGISANLGWKKGIPDYKTLTNSKTAEIITDEFRTVFSTLVR